MSKLKLDIMLTTQDEDDIKQVQKYLRESFKVSLNDELSLEPSPISKYFSADRHIKRAEKALNEPVIEHSLDAHEMLHYGGLFIENSEDVISEGKHNFQQ